MVKKLLFLLDKRFYKSFVFLLFLLIIVTFLEMFSIGLIPVFVVSLLNPEKVMQYVKKFDFLEFFFALDFSQLIIFLVTFLILSFILKNLFIIFYFYYIGKIRQKLRLNIKKKLIDKYFELSYKNFLSNNPSYLIRNITLDGIHTADLYFSLVSIFREVLVILGIVIIILFSSNINNIFIFFILLLSCYLFFKNVKNKINKSGKLAQLFIGKEIKELNQAFNGFKELLISSKEENFKKKFLFNSNELENNKFIKSFISNLPKIVFEISAIIILTSIPALYFFIGKFDQDVVVATMTLIAVSVARMMPAMNTISNGFTTILFSKVSLDLIYREIFEEVHHNNLKKKNSNLKFSENINQLEIKNIFFAYSDKKIIEDLSLKIKENEIIGIFGESGSGKTTLVDLIMGLHFPNKGSIFFNNNKNIFDKLNYWQSKIGYVSQNFYILDESIKNNIVFYEEQEKIDKNKLKLAIEKSELKEFIENLEKKEETIIGNQGAKLSGGQRQRIAIARALYKNPQILIFDEATSSLDVNSEQKIIENIKKLKNNKIIIIISHKLKPLEICDRIYFMDKGNLIYKENQK